MIVTLYKECKLNNKYNDCFFNKSYLETYLGTLTKKSFTIDNTFSREEDRLVFENEEYFITKDYNYIKIEDNVIGTFYAFIRSIEWINGLFLLYYEEDIWHNWFESIKVRNGLLTRSLSKKIHYSGETEKSIKYFSYPIESESNDTPVTTKLTEPYTGIVVKLQLYSLNTQGEETERYPAVYYLATKTPISPPSPQSLDLSFNTDYEDVIIYLINGQQSQTINGYNYQIDEIYFVPLDFISAERYVATTTNHFEVSGIYPSLCMIIPSFSSSAVRTVTYTIAYDRKNFAVGNYSNPIKFNNNGTSITIKIETYCTGSSVRFILYLNNNIIDITKDYYVDLPFNTITASALQIKRMQYDNDMMTYEADIRKLNEQINAYKGSIAGSSLSLAGGITSGAGSIVSGATKGDVGGILHGAGAILNSAGSFTSNLSRDIANIDIAKINIEVYQNKIGLLNRKIYDNTYIVKNDINFINGIKGLLVWSVVEDNTEQVDGVKNLFGFIVNQIITKNIFTTEENTSVAGSTEKYNIYRFDDVSLYGAIAQDYITIFEKILNKGIRVWFKGDIQI